MRHSELPEVRGEYRFDFPLRSLSFFKVGGCCDVLYTPTDTDDLSQFLSKKPENLEINVLGNMSNVLISDYGISGCVIQLTHLDKIKFYDKQKFN